MKGGVECTYSKNMGLEFYPGIGRHESIKAEAGKQEDNNENQAHRMWSCVKDAKTMGPYTYTFSAVGNMEWSKAT